MAKLLDKYGQPYSDRFVTPLWIADRMPPRDLDPCSDPRSHIRSRKRYSLEMNLNGLKLPWWGSIFLNFPYSDPMPWVEKLAIEWAEGRVTDAIVLPKMDCSTTWWKALMAISPIVDLWLFHDRIQFDEPPELVAARIAKFAAEGKKGGEKSSNNFCSAIVHLRRDVTDLPALQLGDVAECWVKAAA